MLIAVRVELGQRGVERGGLAAAGGAGHQHQAVRLRERVAQQRQRVGLQAERVEPSFEAAAVEQAEDELLAEERREHGHAHVQRRAVGPS